MNNYYYTYVLFSKKDKQLYLGYTHDLQGRLEAHKNGEVPSTKDRRPIVFVYAEACLDKRDAVNREQYFKTYRGKMFIRNRLKSYFTRVENEDNKSKNPHDISLFKLESI